MASQNNPGRLRIRAHQVPQSIRFLRRLEVPATRLAGIFGETADNIRHIDSRSYIDKPIDTPPALLDRQDLALLKLSEKERTAQRKRNMQGVRIRTVRDFEQTESLIRQIASNNISIGFEEAYESLLAIAPTVANARHDRAQRVKLLLHEKIAWFAQPLGRVEAALFHARKAMQIAVDAFRESAGEKQYLVRYGEAALLASICLQKLYRTAESLEMIDAADGANNAAGLLRGSEHLRQRGAAFIQLGRKYDREAGKLLLEAPSRMEEKSEAKYPVDLKMVGLRQRAFLRPHWGWEKSCELVAETRAAYGPDSMQCQVAAKSAAVAGLKLATPESIQYALDLLTPRTSVEQTHVLAITPELGLDSNRLDPWLRFAFHQDVPR